MSAARSDALHTAATQRCSTTGRCGATVTVLLTEVRRKQLSLLSQHASTTHKSEIQDIMPNQPRHEEESCTPIEGSGVTQNVPQLQEDWAIGTFHHFPSFEASPLFTPDGTDAQSAQVE